MGIWIARGDGRGRARHRGVVSALLAGLFLVSALIFGATVPSAAMAATSTKLYISTSASTATIRSKVVVTGKFVKGSGAVIVGRSIRFERYNGSEWVLVKRMTTNSHGNVSASVQPANDTKYRYRYPGSATYQKSVSATKLVGGYTAPSKSWNGSGTSVVGPFTLEKGLSIFRCEPDATDSNFIVWLADSNGNEIELLANEIGSVNSSKATNISATGKYYLNVDSDTSWTISVKQPRQLTAPATRSFVGDGSSASNLFTLSKAAYKFSWAGSGTGYFGITLLDRDGNYVGLIANEIDPTTGSKLVAVPAAGQYILDIEAEGPWSLKCVNP